MNEALKKLSCEVLLDPVSRSVYSTDASIYEILPAAVVIPRTKTDCIETVAIARRYNVPIIPRGAATGITGGAIGNGIVIDTSKHLNKILSIDREKKEVVVEPGVIQEQLNERVSSYNLRLGPDTSTGNRATIGGMVANNAAGAYSLRYGQMIDHVIAVELLLYDGSLVCFSKKTANGPIYHTMQQIITEYNTEIFEHFPRIRRIASGYNLKRFAETGNLATLITGSEGTLGFITEITLKLVEKPGRKKMLLFSDEMSKGIERAKELLSFNPLSLEMVDRTIIEAGKTHPAMRGKLEWLRNRPEALFIAEFDDTSPKEISALVCNGEWIESQETMEQVWQLRKSGLGLLLSKRSYNRAVAFIEDSVLPLEEVGSFLTAFKALLRRFDKTAGIYGHIGAGCLHIRPYIDMRSANELQCMQTIMQETAQLVHAKGGALSSEHGDGILRAPTTEKLFGKKLFESFCKTKHCFDPENLMNPGKIIPEQPFLENLRLSPETVIKSFPTFYDYSKEGGFELSVDLCNGNGQCRKPDGLMCPSFQATLDEKDSTRARANALRALIHGKIPFDSALSQEFYDIMDLCIQCKGCKTECPSQVDMAKMKSAYYFSATA